MRKTYIWDKERQTFVEKHKYRCEPKGPMVMPDIEPFKSPVTGEVITSRPKRNLHMKAHEVTDASDYSPEFRERASRERMERLTGQTRQDRAERIEALKYALEKNR